MATTVTAPPMFGAVCAGRLVQTNVQQVDEHRFVFNIDDVASVNHVVVFLTGAGYSATVHFLWPGKDWQLLGMLSNAKPSAIFRLRGAAIPSSGVPSSNGMVGNNQSAGGAPPVQAVVGISVEPEHQVAAQMATLPAASSASASQSAGGAPAGPPQSTHAHPALSDPLVLAPRIAKHLFSYLSSFADSGGAVGQRNGETVVPVSALQKWFDSFMAKLRNTGTGFLERED